MFMEMPMMTSGKKVRLILRYPPYHKYARQNGSKAPEYLNRTEFGTFGVINEAAVRLCASGSRFDS
jgi:hypothetical protein